MNKPYTRVAVVGCGTIGRSWAVCFATAGNEVVLYDAATGVAERARALIGEMLVDLERQAAITNARDVLSRLTVAATLAEAAAGTSHIQESIVEERDAKQTIFQALDAVAPKGATLASSSSAIMPSDFLEDIQGRDRCLVAHPFNPPHLIPLVEIVPSRWTHPSVVESCVTLMQAIGQSPIVIQKEVPGFVGNRLQAAVVNEAMNLVGRGIVSPRDLDLCMTAGLGRRWAFAGPFATMDLNAPSGFADYAAKFGDSYQHLGRDLGVAEAWLSHAREAVEQWRRSEVPVEEVAAAQARRDHLLFGLNRWLEQNRVPSDARGV